MKSAAGLVELPNGVAVSADQLPNSVDVNLIEARLPCRTFRIGYKVAETAEFSLTTEFLLRLSRLADGMQESSVAEFFGFNTDETRFIVDFVESAGYARRKNGRVYLTESGHALFSGGDEPALFEVRTKLERFDFDLIAFAPDDRGKPLTAFEYAFPELELSNTEVQGRPSERIFKSFSRFFNEFRFKRGGSKLEKQTLYTIDDIQTEQRYSSTLPITITVRTDDPTFPETNLFAWRTGMELEDRAPIVESCANLVKKIRICADHVSPEAEEWFADCAPDQLSRYFKNGSFDAAGFFRATVRQAGELRIDRRTVRIIGSLWTDPNRARFASALKYALAHSAHAPAMQFWVSPETPYAGLTSRLPEMLDVVSRNFRAEEQDGPSVRAVIVGEKAGTRPFRQLFDCVINIESSPLSSGLEVFLLPAHVAYVALYTPVGVKEGLPIPLGILSFDSNVIERVQKLVAKLITGSPPVAFDCHWPSKNAFEEIKLALTGSKLNDQDSGD
jgi:hypothetical protein